MLSVSQGFKEGIAEGRRVELKATLSFSDGEVIELTGKDFAMGGYTFSGSTSSLSKFQIGAAIIGTATVTLVNYDHRWDTYHFGGATIAVYVGMEVDGLVEWVLRGTYGLEQPKSYGSTIQLPCQDNMRKLEHNYSEVATSYPATLATIVADICNGCGLTLGTPHFPHEDYEVQARPDDEDASCIEVIGWVAQVAGCFAAVDVEGRLRLRWYEETMFDVEDGYADVSAIRSIDVAVDEVGVSGVYVTAWRAASDNGSYKEGESALYGIDGYVLFVSNNPLVEYGRAKEVADMIGPTMGNMWFRPLTVGAVADPRVEAGDPLLVTDGYGRTYRSWVTQITWKATGSMTLKCGAETSSRISQPKRRSTNEVATEDLTDVVKNVSPDNFYMYHGENIDPLQVSTETTVAMLTFATVADTRVAVNVTVEHDMNIDGDVVGRLYINQTLMKTVEVYEARGKAVLDFMWSSDFSKDRTYDLKLTIETVGVISQIRENDADNQTLWNRSRANSKVYWQEMCDTETWDSMRSTPWEVWASGTAATGTWAAIMQEDELDWQVVEPVATQPTLTIEPQRGQMLLFGRGLARVDNWDGVVRIYEEMSLLSLTDLGLVVDYSDSVSASRYTPQSSSLSDSMSLSLGAVGLALGYSDELGFGEDHETVWGDDTTCEPEAAVTVVGGTWSAISSATVTTVDFGEDLTVDGIASVAVTVTGTVAFSLSFDRGSTWGTPMTATELNAKTDWPNPPLRIRMDMESGSRVNGMIINYERS